MEYYNDNYDQKFNNNIQFHTFSLFFKEIKQQNVDCALMNIKIESLRIKMWFMSEFLNPSKLQ